MRTKHYFFFILLLLLPKVYAFSASSKYILYVTDSKNDSGFVNLLTSHGYNVDYEVGTYSGTLSQAKLDSANAATLIIISRTCSSIGYGGTAALATQWNGISAPLMSLSMWLSRSSRWMWFNSTTIGCQSDTVLTATPDGMSDVLFNGITLTAADTINPYDSIGSDMITVGDAGNGQVLARIGDSTVMIARWDAGYNFYNSTTQAPSGTRVYFSAGESDCGSSKSNAVTGRFNLNADGQKMFLNEVGQFYPPSAIHESKYNPVSLSVFPNPASDMLRVNFKAENAGLAKVNVLDITGKSLIEKSLNYIAGKNSTEINISGLSQGVYMLELTTENNQVVQRVVVR